MFELDALSQTPGTRCASARAEPPRARRRAHVGADAVVGVETAHRRRTTGAERRDRVHGVRHRRQPRGAAAPSKAPVLTELSVADYAKLVQAGFEPLGIVAWSSVFFAGYVLRTQGWSSRRRAWASPQPRAARIHAGVLQRARDGRAAHERTRPRARRQRRGRRADRPRASAAISSAAAARYQRGGLMVTFHAIGTAIRQTEEAPLYPPRRQST